MQKKAVDRPSWITWFSTREREKGRGSGVLSRVTAFPSMSSGTSASPSEQAPWGRGLCRGRRRTQGSRRRGAGGTRRSWLEETELHLFQPCSHGTERHADQYVLQGPSAGPDCSSILRVNSGRCACTVAWEDEEQWLSKNQRNVRARGSEAMLQFLWLLLFRIPEKMATTNSFDKIVSTDYFK